MYKKKVGIIALGMADNFGAVLQCHSLCDFLNDMKFDAEIVSFVPGFIIGRYPLLEFDYSSIRNFVLSVPYGIIKFPSKMTKKARFYFFRIKRSNYSKKKYIRSVKEDDYDYYVVGSDQVFNLELTKDDVEFFLPKISDSRKKITYAASLGLSVLDSHQSDEISKGLAEFSYISIRERTGSKIVSELLPGIEVYHHMDPVFLHGRDYWEKLESKRPVKSKYILIYAFKGFDLAYRMAKSIDSNCKIITISDSIRKIKPDVATIRSAGPCEFLSLIHYAKYIITDSFHATAFSVIYNKQFFTILYPGTESRMVDMLSEYGLVQRIIRDEKDISNDLIDYTYVKELNDKFVGEALDYFEKALSGDKT